MLEFLYYFQEEVLVMNIMKIIINLNFRKAILIWIKGMNVIIIKQKNCRIAYKNSENMLIPFQKDRIEILY